MFDLHYDLLTICFLAEHLKKYSVLKKIQKQIKQGETKGLFANLYFMSEQEMKEKFHLQKEEINVLKMFQESKKRIEELFFSFPILYSIEGCDLISNEMELEKLHSYGLDAILLVWNHENQYGSGIKGKKGLTKKGRKFLQKAISLGMGIDLSHMNSKTFYDTIEVIKEEQRKGKQIICYASHSNSYQICPVPRNLDDDQLLALKEVGGMIGCVLYPPFVGSRKIEDFIKHLLHMKEIFGIDKVMISSDDMEFYSLYQIKSDTEKGFFPYHKIKRELEKKLQEFFSKEEIELLLFKNGEFLYNEIKEIRK